MLRWRLVSLPLRGTATGTSWTFDEREHFVERHPPPAVDLLIEKSRLLVIDGRCRERDVVGAVAA
jgi:hypothetical protein